MRAVIFCHPDTAALEVAGLPLLDRLVVAAHRAGCETVQIVGLGNLPSLKRSRALGASFEIATSVSGGGQPLLAMTSAVLVQASDIERVIAGKGRLVHKNGTLLPIGVIANSGEADEIDGGSLPERFDKLDRIEATGVAIPVADNESARLAENALWRSITSSSDGTVDAWFNRPIGRLFSKVLIRTAITPNQISICATILGVFAGWLLAGGNYRDAIWGALLLQVSAIIDCVDGDVARIAFKETSIGKWLDIVGDQVVHIAVFVGLGVGLWRPEVGATVIGLAASASIGVVISFIVVLRGMLLPKNRENVLLQKLIDKTTNRDFSVILLALAIADQLTLFLWMVGIGVHLFWILALSVQLFCGPRKDGRAE